MLVNNKLILIYRKSLIGSYQFKNFVLQTLIGFCLVETERKRDENVEKVQSIHIYGQARLEKKRKVMDS